MSTAQPPRKGVIHGKLIELESTTDLPDGQLVTVRIELSQPESQAPPGEGIERSAGAFADDPEGLDEYLDWNRGQRRASRREISP